MSKHTPGPWRVGRPKSSEHLVVTHHGVQVAMAVFLGSVQQRANARLIAAAPELLEALRRLTARYERLCDSGDCGHPHDWRDDDEEYKPAAAILSKINGDGE